MQLVSELTCFNTGKTAEDLAADIIISHYCGNIDRIEDNMLSVRTSLIPLLVQIGIKEVNNFALWTQFPNTWYCALDQNEDHSPKPSLCQVTVCFTIWMYVQELFKDRCITSAVVRRWLILHLPRVVDLRPAGSQGWEQHALASYSFIIVTTPVNATAGGPEGGWILACQSSKHRITPLLPPAQSDYTRIRTCGSGSSLQPPYVQPTSGSLWARSCPSFRQRGLVNVSTSSWCTSLVSLWLWSKPSEGEREREREHRKVSVHWFPLLRTFASLSHFWSFSSLFLSVVVVFSIFTNIFLYPHWRDRTCKLSVVLGWV